MTPGATPLRGGGGVVRPAIPGASPAARIVLPGPFSGKTAAAVRAMEMMAAGEVFFLFFQVFWFSERPCLEAVRPDRRTSGVQAEGLRDCLTVFCNAAGLSGRCLQHRRAVCPLRPLRQATDSLVSGRHFGSALLARRGMEVRGALAACRSGTAYTPSSSGVCSSCRERSSLASTASSQSALVKAWASEGKVPARTSSA